MRTIKEEVLRFNDFSSLEEEKEIIGHWIEVDYNKLYVHSELEYLSQEDFEQRYWGQISLREAA